MKNKTKDAEGFVEIPFGAFDSETISWTYTIPEGFTAKIEDGKIVVEKKESEKENLKNKSGYYKAGKFWKASSLWNAVKDKTSQRVPNRYILQECTWNIGTLQRFADEIKNVQEVSLDYPIILDMNGNILDGAHRVVKAYLEGKDIDIVYLGDDEWPEPDYDEEKAVNESDGEKIRKAIITYLRSCHEPYMKEWIAYLEKQKAVPENWNDVDRLMSHPLYLKGFDAGREMQKIMESDPDAIEKTPKQDYSGLNDFERAIHRGFLCAGVKNVPVSIIKQAAEEALKRIPAEWSEEDEKMIESLILEIDKYVFFAGIESDKIINRLKSLRPKPHWKPSKEQMKLLQEAEYALQGKDCHNRFVGFIWDLKKLM